MVEAVSFRHGEASSQEHTCPGEESQLTRSKLLIFNHLYNLARVGLSPALHPRVCGLLGKLNGGDMENISELTAEHEMAGEVPGIVIHGRFEPLPRPSILAFIWGGKVRPVPALPFGRMSA